MVVPQVTIRGPKEDVHRAKQMLVDLSNEKQLASYTTEVRPEALILCFLGLFVVQSKANFTKHLYVTQEGIFVTPQGI